jgi:hypothetical protein
MDTKEKVSSIIESQNELDDQIHMRSLKISMEISAFLNSYFLSKEHPSELNISHEEAIKYGFAVFAWTMTGKDPFSIFESTDPALLFYKKELESNFGLEILSIDEHSNRRKALGGQEMNLQYGDLFFPLSVFKA